MMNVRQGVVDLLATNTTFNVKATRLDRVKPDMCPAISVLNITKTHTQKGHHLMFQATNSIGIVATVAKTDDYDSALDALVDSVLAVIFTDIAWQQQFEAVPQVQIAYDYDIAGDTNLAQAKIAIDVQYTDEYIVDIQDSFTNLHLDVDLSEADGVIDAVLDIELPIA